MNAHLIASTKTLLNSLTRALKEPSIVVKAATQRAVGQRLSAFLPSVDSDILILEISPDQQASDLLDLEALSVRRPELAVILLCNQSDRDFLLSAMKAGAREVLSNPPSKEDLEQALKRIAEHREKLDERANGPGPAGKLVAFISCKGGSGATFIATNMAHLISGEFHRSCALIDLDLQSGDASFYMGHGMVKNNISDLTQQVDRLDGHLLSSSMHAVAPQLGLMAAPDEPATALSITAGQLERVLKVAKTQYDVVIVDLSQTLDALTITALDLADVIYLITENMMPCVRDTKRLVKLFRSLGYGDEKLRLVVNRYRPGVFVDLKQIEEASGLKVDHTLPNDFPAVAEAISLGEPLSKVNSNNAILKALRKSTAELLHTAVPKPLGWLGRWVGKVA